MNAQHPLQNAIRIVGLTALARDLKISYQAIRKWQRAGRMPRTEWTGETNYCVRIDALTDGQVPRDVLLGKWPAPAPAEAAAQAQA